MKLFEAGGDRQQLVEMAQRPSAIARRAIHGGRLRRGLALIGFDGSSTPVSWMSDAFGALFQALSGVSEEIPAASRPKRRRNGVESDVNATRTTLSAWSPSRGAAWAARRRPQGGPWWHSWVAGRASDSPAAGRQGCRHLEVFIAHGFIF